ncbi:hypothetical protein [Coxiella burnetii]|uniref:hypothetical protein n=1 Tax=Coxiella burnetii TaxID=777 RepID=UPI0021769418|nr:hypothetical protein [Coxiella burnetii]
MERSEIRVLRIGSRIPLALHSGYGWIRFVKKICMFMDSSAIETVLNDTHNAKIAQ